LSAAPTEDRRVFVSSLADLGTSRVCWVRLSADASGRPREAVIVLDPEGIPRAYLNLCRHLPIPLDGGSRKFLIEGELQCVTHGARYRLNDGLCVTGPCRGQSLRPLKLELTSGLLFVIDDTSVCI